MAGEAEKYILAIDLGTSGVRVALVSVHGEVIGWESEPLSLRVLPDGGAEQDPGEWWDAILTASRRLLGRGLVPPEAVVAVCASAQGYGTVPVDRDGNCLMPALIWLDSRGAEHVRRVVGGAIRLAGYGVSKLLRWIHLTGGAPFLSGRDCFGHILYIRLEHPEIYRKTYKFLDPLGYLNLRLTGQFVTTSDSVVAYWVTDNRDPANIRYHNGLIKMAGVEREKYPEIRRSIDVLGPLRPDAAEALGLPRSVQVVAGAFDVPAAAIGSGAVRDYEAHLYLGTSSWIAVHVPFKKTDVFHAMASVPCAIPDRFLLIAAQETAGGNLTWLRDNVLYHQDPLLQAEKPSDFFEAFSRVAEQVPPGSHGVIYTPWLYGERAPVDDHRIRAAFHNLSLENTRSDLVRAVLEGVAFNSRWILGPVERFCGRPMDPITMVGGGAQSDVWCQIHADVLHRTIRQIEHPALTNARGAALIAAVGLGYIRFSDIPQRTRYRNEYHPNPQNRKLYDELYAEFVRLYKQNRGIYARLNRSRAFGSSKGRAVHEPDANP